MHIKENTICVQGVSGHKTIYISIPSTCPVHSSIYLCFILFYLAIEIYIVYHVLFVDKMFRFSLNNILIPCIRLFEV